MLTPAATGSSASYPLSPGSVYSFTVTAVDASGTVFGSSTPWTVSLRPAAARISLRATRLGGTRRVTLDARLAVEQRPGAARGRTLVLETLKGSRWARAATAVTDPSGRAVWRDALTPGSHLVRARYPGTAEVGAATSAPLTVRVG